MALNYYMPKETGGPPKLGSFWKHYKFNVDEIRKGAFQGAAIPASTDFKLGKLRGGWVIRDSYIKIPTASNASVTYNIGITEAGTEIAAAIDATDTTTYADWVQGTIDPNDSTQSLALATEDHYLWLMIDSAAISTGELEVMLEIVAGADDND